MATLSEAQAAAAVTLTTSFKTQQNREAAKIAALIALYYQQRVNVQDPTAVDRWLERYIPRLIRAADDGANRAMAYYTALRRLEVPAAEPYRATASLGTIDEGVRRSLLAVGPYDYMNKAADIRRLDIPPSQQRALLVEAKQVTTKKVAQAVVRHAQAGSRQTIHDNSARDRVALGWVRVTRAKPCHFCAMLASRGIHYRAFGEDSFVESNARFTGEGDAKVHDECGCSLKPVYTTNDPLVDRTKQWADMWERWGAGGGRDAALRFRRGYDHWSETGELLSWEQVESAA